ncbi:hypothetical protein D7V88_25745 [Corallococcus terminator]|uniref:Ricin B lectin domain-containing protein n=2 Tax=Corallococcus terminator TaxID=2316733 RepID=A0A3A8IEU0_9BACT|nr:hypothetical protein D7V88_25745 [Corallococcus terminator]
MEALPLLEGGSPPPTPAPSSLANRGAPFLLDEQGKTDAREDPRDTCQAGQRDYEGLSCFPTPEAPDAHSPVEVVVRRSILALLWGAPLCFFASFAAEARSLQSANANYCIGVNHASEVAGANVKQFRCDGGENQGWTQQKEGEGYFSLKNNKSGLCMGVDHASTKPGSNLKQFVCDHKENQNWTFDRCPDGSGQCLLNKKSGLCATAEPVAHDVQLEQEQCIGGPTQVWGDYTQ